MSISDIAGIPGTEKIRILHVLNTLDPGGTAKTMQLFVTFLNKKLFYPVVWAHSPGPRGEALKKNGITVISGSKLEETIRRFQPHIVHLHRAGWPEPKLIRPLKTAFRDDPMGLTDRLPVIIETNVFGRYDPSYSGRLINITLLVSHFCARRLRDFEGRDIRPPRYQVLYNPVDTDLIAALSPEPEKRDYSRPVFGRISRPDPGKWSPLALEPLLIVREKRPDFTCLIVGGTNEAKIWVKEHNLTDNVHFLNPLTNDRELADFLGQISFLVHANSTGESFGLVIAEAMAAALPVITHNCTNWKDNAQTELVDNEITGLIADNTKDYATAILRLLSNATLCRNLGMAGQKKAARLFRVQDLTKKLESIYLAALTGEEHGND